MNIFETLQSLLLQDLSDLREIQKRGWFVWPMTRAVKEERLGRCCYLAEEFLAPADLYTLKHRVGLNERQWRAYKVKVSGQ